MAGSEQAAPGEDAPTIELEGYVDAVMPSGMITGWARGRPDGLPCHVQVWSGPDLIAATVADQFRHDLLESGVGHGHYSYAARPRQALLPGPHRLTLREAGLGLVFPQTVDKVVHAPPRQTPATQSVEDLLSPGACWTDEQVLARLDCLQLEPNFRRMGALRFLDVVYRYVFGRWVDEGGIGHYLPGLKTGERSAESVFRDVLGSDERRERWVPLPSPFDHRFPFKLSLG